MRLGTKGLPEITGSLFSLELGEVGSVLHLLAIAKEYFEQLPDKAKATWP
jgi:hypothetical protein